jgi:hypothetical protein
MSVIRHSGVFDRTRGEITYEVTVEPREPLTDVVWPSRVSHKHIDVVVSDSEGDTFRGRLFIDRRESASCSASWAK